MNPRSTSTPASSTRTRSPTSSPRSPRTSFPSIGGVDTRTHVPLFDAPVTMRVEPLADARLDDERGGRLAHLALDLVRRVLLPRAVRGERFELARACTAPSDPRAPP